MMANNSNGVKALRPLGLHDSGLDGVATGSFHIKVNTVRNRKPLISNSAADVRGLSTKVRIASHKVAQAVGGTKGTRVASEIDRLADGLLNDASHIDSLAGAIEFITRAYEQGDERAAALINRASLPKQGAHRPRPGFPIFPGVRERIPEQAMKEREKAHDLSMQSEVFDMLENEERFTEEYWKKATVKERKQILRDLAERLAVIYGITVPSTISFEKMKKSSIIGYYSYSDSKIAINSSQLNDKDSYYLRNTIVHEMRHAYQHAVVEHPEQYRVSKETVRQWKENFEHYVSEGDKAPDGHTYTYDEYRQQAVEWDAWNFAKQNVDGYTPDYAGSW